MKNSCDIVIGDVHGCYEEARELIRLSGFKKGRDRLFFIGDLVNKGPDSKGAYRLLKETSGFCIMGNHEQKFLDVAKGLRPEGDFFAKLKNEFGGEFNDFLDEISRLPYFIREKDFLLVHAGILPGETPETTPKSELISLRTVCDPSTGMEVPWYESYNEPKPVIFGHWAQLRGIVRKNLFGLDMGCVYGKQLRALNFQTKEVIDVSAKEIYCPIEG